MWFFSSAKKTCAGIDFGGSGIKVVVMENNGGKAVLSNYALVELPFDWVRDQTPETQRQMAAYLAALKKKLSLDGMPTYSALPTFSVFSTLIRLPKQPVKSLQAAIESEAKKYVPLPLSEINVDYKVLEEPKVAPGMPVAAADMSKILLTAAPKAMISRYADAFKQAGITLAGLETEGFAIGRAFVGKERGAVMVVDLGASTSDILIYEDGAPSFNRTLDLGGSTLTLQLSRQLSLDANSAEQLKRDVGLLPEPPTGTALQTMKQSPLEAVMAPIINEIRYSFSLFERQRGRRIEKIILTGGTSYVPNLAYRVEKTLNVRVLLGNPWARYSTPPVLQSALEEIAPRMSVAAGLALRGLEEK